MNGEWRQTDPSCNQYGRRIGEGIYEFKEDRIIDPITNKIETFETEIVLWDYSSEEKESALASYGHNKKDMIHWTFEEIDWITAECLFELSN